MSDFPKELREMSRWILWREEIRDGRVEKVPVGLAGENISVTDDSNWRTFDDLVELIGILGTHHTGFGFVFTAEDGLVGIDLDGAFEKPFDVSSIKPWAAEILDRFRGAYVTLSPSGLGAHIIVRGAWGYGHKIRLEDGAVEVYSDRRFFTMTGQLVAGYGASELVDGTAALEWLAQKYFAERNATSLPRVEIGPPPGLPDDVQKLRRALELGRPDDEVLPLLREALASAGELGERALGLLGGDAEVFERFHEDQSAIEQSLANAFAIAVGGDRELIAELLVRFSPRWDRREKLERDDYLERTAAKAVEWYRETHRVDIIVGRTVLEPSVRRLAVDTLRWRYSGRIFRYGSAPVVVEGDHLFALDPVRISVLLADAAIFRRDSNKKPRIDPPERLTRALAAELSTREGLPELRGIVRAPLVFPDGRVVMENGYDPDSKLLFVDLPRVDVPGSPTREDARRAYATILEILNYSFSSPADEAAAVAYLLTAVLRPAVPLAPLFLVTAPEAGSGKTSLAQVGGIVAQGRIPDVLPEPEDEDEFRKRIDASLLEGRALIILDNLHRDIRSATLEAAITSEHVTIRPLGRSETRTVPNTATFVATGNNIAPFGDMKRRTVVIRIDGRSEALFAETADGRKQSYLHEVLERREELLSALLTIALAYLRAGRPRVRVLGFPSFEEWAHMVRDPLVWLGAADPVETVKRTYAEDESSAVLATFFELLHEEFGSEPFSTRDIMQRFSRVGVALDESGRGDLFRDVATQLKLVNRFGELDTTAIGYKLRAWRDRVFGGLKLERVGTAHEKVTTWRLVPVSTPATVGDNF